MEPTWGTQSASAEPTTPVQPRADQPVYVGCVQVCPESSEKYTPDTPTPGVKGHVVSLPALQASMSMLSFAPATNTVGWVMSTASAGSFCLFCANGDG